MGRSQGIKAIETRYKGYRFRSRLEARWAVWLDTMQIRYVYETEGFVLSDGTRYLPDFWLPFPGGDPHPTGLPPEQGYWLEIKPKALEMEEEKKAALLVEETHHAAIALAGDPWPGEFGVYHFRDGRVNRLIPIVCALCNQTDVQDIVEWRDVWGWKRSLMTCLNCDGGVPKCMVTQSAYMLGYGFFRILSPFGFEMPDFKQMRSAFAAARSARFEHGETPS